MAIDLFEDLRKSVGCMYVSDLRLHPHKNYAKKILRSFDLEKYPLQQLNDMAQYLYDTKLEFEHSQQAGQFFGCCR